MRHALLAWVVWLAVLPPVSGADDSLAPGKLLVAEGDLSDPNFRRTVVLLLHYDAGEAFGLILNRPTSTRVADVFPDLPGLEGREDVVHAGGPVERGTFNLLFRSEEASEGTRHVFADVHFARGADLLSELLKKKEGTPTFRLFAGYAGWGPGQLDREVARGDWKIADADPVFVFEKTAEWMWRFFLPGDPGPWTNLLRPHGVDPG